MTSGAATYVVLGILAAYGVKVPAQVAEALPLIIGGIGGWVTHSVGATTHVVVTDPNGRRVESTTTGAVPIQPQRDAGPYFAGASAATPVDVPRGTVVTTPVPQQVPAQEPTPAWTPPAEEPVTHEVPDEAPEMPDDNVTQILAGNSASFMASRYDTNGH